MNRPLMSRTRGLLFATLMLAVMQTDATAQVQPPAPVHLRIQARPRAVVIDEDQDTFDAVEMQVPTFYLNEATFNGWAFGTKRTEDAVRTHLDSFLALKVENIERVCGISAEQKAKLQRAGRGDVKRFFDQVDEKRRKYLNVAHDQGKINEILQDIQPLQIRLSREPFADGSFFAKTLKSTLNAEQVSRLEKAALEKKQFRYKAKVELVVASLDLAVGFRTDQRERLLTLLLEETVPPKWFGPYDVDVVMYQLSRLPEAKVKVLFDDIQWGLLQRRIEQTQRGSDSS